MESRVANEEKEQFSARLQRALVKAQCPNAPNDFVKEFNLRADGSSVTVYAARKWLSGTAIPTQEKVQILAGWLGVSSAWLRFGSDDDGPPVNGSARGLATADRVLLEAVHRLSARDRRVVHEMVKSLLRNTSNTG
jgi:transcriptional regulator with XRE-family HTH domain